jgi:putative oxidoreductase
MLKCNPKQCLQAVPQLGCASTALLVLRLIAGIAFIFHGWGKIQQPFGWMGPEAPVPGFFQFLAALSEFGGGIAWVLGFLTPVASVGIGITMAVAVCMHMFVMKDPFVATAAGSGSYEPALLYLGISILFLILGPGKFSLDAKVFGERQCQ